mmetsp:Transcript_29779/g.41897  ORF Transcript_29779/g.41897 Transcript_29779/m.41897 type:complete len:363 (-) Transcript_29779:57-1145(-)
MDSNQGNIRESSVSEIDNNNNIRSTNTNFFPSRARNFWKRKRNWTSDVFVGLVLVLYLKRLLETQSWDVLIGVCILTFIGLFWKYLEQKYEKQHEPLSLVVDHVFPILWCWSPTTYYYQYFMIFIFSNLRYSNFVSPGPTGLYALDLVTIVVIHTLTVINLIFPLLTKRSCGLCVFPTYLYGVAWFIQPAVVNDVLEAMTLTAFPENSRLPTATVLHPYVLLFVTFVDTLHHYKSHHVEEVQFPRSNYTNMNGIIVLVFIFVAGFQNMISATVGFLISLILTLPPASTLISYAIDAESILGLQTVAILGQLIHTLMVITIWPKADHTILGALLRGIVAGRLIVMYAIREESASGTRGSTHLF